MADPVDIENNQQFISLSEYTSNAAIDNNKDNISNMNNMEFEAKAPSHAHPQAAFFTVLFKSLAIGAYVFGSFFTANFVLVFVFVILCLAADFWTVKNVTGRLLVGLRWWNHVKEDGTSEWKFEAKHNENNNNQDSRLFWTSLYLTPCIWILLCIACIVKFNIKWLPLTLVGIALNAAQLWGYWKCRKNANAQNTNDAAWFNSIITQQIGSQIGSQFGRISNNIS